MATPLLPKKVALSTHSFIFGGRGPDIEIRSGVTVFVGPNGCGKTHVLRQLKHQLSASLNKLGLKTRFLAAGRSSPLENFRASVSAPHGRDNQPAYVGSTNHLSQWAEFESVTADYLALFERSDLRLKVEARLQTFFARRLELSWNQFGLQIKLIPDDGGAAYGANDEASGVLQVAALLAAIYDDRVGALIIDEPEISLHPQFQAFILKELIAVSGDPAIDPSKKLVIFATHSPQMLPLKRLDDIVNLVFFNDRSSLPIQLNSNDPQLKSKKLAALFSRLTATHLLAIFAKTVLLVEGPTDELVVTSLASELELPLLATSVQVVPVTGKTEFIEAISFFELIGKKVVVLADLDALSDSPQLVNKFNTHPKAIDSASKHGAENPLKIDAPLRSTFASNIAENWEAIATVAEQHRYWSEVGPDDRTEETKRRSTLATLLGTKSDDVIAAAPDFKAIKSRFTTLMEILESADCFFLRKGTIEDYYLKLGGVSKFEMAAIDVATFATTAHADLMSRYEDVLRAIRAAVGNLVVDENKLLRERLGAALGAAFQTVQEGMSDGTLNTSATAVLKDGQGIFGFVNRSSAKEKKIRVEIKSSLFKRGTFPFEISEKENVTSVIPEKLPPPN